MAHRRLAARLLVVLATLVAFTAILAIWANRQVLNTDNWTRTSTELLERPVIRDALGAYLVDTLYANVDVAGELRQALPERAQALATPAAGALRNLANKAALEALQRPRVQALWADANRQAHRSLLAVIEGDGSAVATRDGVVVLHLKTLLEEMAQRVGMGGRLAAALPPSAADLTVLRSRQLSTAEDVLKVLRGAPYVLVTLSLALFAAALAIAPDWRRRALRAYGWGFVLAGAAALVTRTVAGDALTQALASTASVEPAIAAGWTISTTLLEEAAVATIGYGVAMIVGAWLAGATRPAVALRRSAAPYVRDAAIAYGGLAVFVALLLWWNPTPATGDPALALILIALLAGATEALRRQIRREYPDATRSGDAAARVGGHVRRAADWARHGTASGRPIVVEQVPQPAGAPSQRIAELERLARLRDTGVLDADEFAAQKRQLLAADDAAAAPNGEHVAPVPNPG